ncbi:hypothetical protein Hanom_Chr04g00292051 [Helianthus anomalus]
MLIAISIMVLFLRSETPFCSGVYGAVKALRIPCMSQKSLNSREQYSPPLSLRRDIIFMPDSFSTLAFQILNLWNTSDLVCKKYTQVILLKSSVNNKKYVLPPRDLVGIGPQTSVCTNSSTLDELQA